MVPPINYLAVLVAAVANMVLGFLWYGPLFGKQWMALSGITPERIQAAQAKGMSLAYGLQALGSFLMAWVLAHGIIFGNAYLGMSGPLSGMTAGFYYWLGFVAPVTLGTVLWDGKPWRLWILNSGYYLVALCLMGAILAAWQ